MISENNSNKIKHNKRKIFLAEIFEFLWKRKSYWIFPVVLFLILLIFLIAVGTSPISPFVYTII